MARVDAVVVGAGVVGLAIARALAVRGKEVIIIESESTYGQHGSSRNSEVIHAGIYYPPGSLKARLCLDGKQLLYEYCARRGIGHRRLGKLIVATIPAQLDTLHRLLANAAACGLQDLHWRDAGAVAQIEPQVRCEAALWSPSTGIVDSHGLMRSLLAEAQDHGASIAYASPFRAAKPAAGRITVLAGDDSVECELLINAAGLGAQAVASGIESLDPRRIPARHLTHGVYFTLRGRSPFSHLIYPVPDTASLGIHVTLDLGGQVRFGPDQVWVDHLDYSVDPNRAQRFYPAIRTYFPALADGDLVPGYAGVRSKVQARGEPLADFVIEGPREHHVEGLVNLFGIESPGLTASLAIAEHVMTLVELPPG